MARTAEHNKVDYLLKNIPGDLWDAFRKKCDANEPALSMRWAILQLIARFSGQDPVVLHRPVRARKEPPVKRLIKPITSSKELAEAPAVPTTAPPQPVSDVPDLGNSF